MAANLSDFTDGMKMPKLTRRITSKSTSQNQLQSEAACEQVAENPDLSSFFTTYDKRDAVFFPDKLSRIDPAMASKIQFAQKNRVPGEEKLADCRKNPGFIPVALNSYLIARENYPEDILKLKRVLRMPEVILEIGCGTCDTAIQLALKNPEKGVISTDLYDWSGPDNGSSYYQKVALRWKNRDLPAQRQAPENLVILRAEADILDFLPDSSIDTVLMINPEPKIGEMVIAYLRDSALKSKLKNGSNQIVVLPYSRELGICSCGGFEFEHAEDWSAGLGFILGSGLKFRREKRVIWHVDLRESSPYSKNSTQSEIFVHGTQPSAIPGKTAANSLIRLLGKVFGISHF